VVRARSDAGVIVLTARDALPDRLRGLHSGADDYLVKPFDLDELTARVTVVLRRLRRVPATIQIEDLVVDTAAGLVLRGSTAIDLTSTERRLLDYLATHRGQVLSKTKILTAVWGYEDYDPNLVEVHICSLRRKLEAHGGRLLHTVRGVGYLLGSRL
jgi:DNA-binding response OmpR family regulator